MISNGEKYIKQKLDQLEVPFDPANWEKAARLLDQRKPKKKKPVIGWIMLAASLAAIAWFILPVSDPAPATEKGTISQKQDTKTIVQEETKTPAPVTAPTNTEKTEERAPVSTHTTVVFTPANAAPRSERPRVDVAAAPVENVLPGFISHESLPVKEAETTVPVENSGTAIAQNQDQPVVAPAVEPAKTAEIAPSKENNLIPPVAENNPAPETVKQAENKTEKKDAQKKNVRHLDRDLVIGLAGGASFNRKIDKTVSDNFAVSPMFGIYADKQLGFKGRLQARVSYSSIGADESVSKSFSGKNYGFGSVQDSVVIAANRLNYMHASLLYGYQLTENIRIQGGAGVAYVFDAVSSYTTYTRENESSNTTSSTRNAYGYMNGLNQWTYSLQLGAEYQSKRGLRYGVLFENGLNPLVKEKYYGGVQARSMFNFNVYLGYDLAKIKSK